jgi:hypothetical protein
MNGLLSDHFIEHFLKGLRRTPKPGFPSGMDALERSELEKNQASHKPRKQRTLKKRINHTDKERSNP